MRFAVFVTPFFNETAVRFIASLLDLPGLRLAVTSGDVEENLPAPLRARIVKHFRVEDAQDPAQIIASTRWIGAHVAPVDRLLVVNEHSQLAVAEARDALGLPGTGEAVMRNFRDKSRMKDKLRAAGLPCARHCLAPGSAEALRFAKEVGFPLIVKPPTGAGAAGTFVAKDAADLSRILEASATSPASPALLEELVTGDEHSFDAVIIEGKPIWHSITRYLPNVLEVVNNPWIQWRLVVPREIDAAPELREVPKLGFAALGALGLRTGICHLEWFRCADGRVVISEVAARPGGAQIMVLCARAGDFDMYGQVARLLAFSEFEPPRERKYATGAAFLRGASPGSVRAVRGIEEALRRVGPLITDARWPRIGDPRATSYEGEGYVLVRHPETRVVEEALRTLNGALKVEMG